MDRLPRLPWRALAGTGAARCARARRSAASGSATPRFAAGRAGRRSPAARAREASAGPRRARRRSRDGMSTLHVDRAGARRRGRSRSPPSPTCGSGPTSRTTCGSRCIERAPVARGRERRRPRPGHRPAARARPASAPTTSRPSLNRRRSPTAACRDKHSARRARRRRRRAGRAARARREALVGRRRRRARPARRPGADLRRRRAPRARSGRRRRACSPSESSAGAAYLDLRVAEAGRRGRRRAGHARGRRRLRPSYHRTLNRRVRITQLSTRGRDFWRLQRILAEVDSL